MSSIETKMQLARAFKADPAGDHSGLRQQHKAERLAEHIRSVVESAPPLTPEQRDRLALLLSGGDAA